MWCLSRANGERSFHATKDAATVAAGDDTAAVIWWDAFDYEAHNPGDERARWFAPLVAEERARGLAYVAQRIDELRRHWLDPWGPEAAS